MLMGVGQSTAGATQKIFRRRFEKIGSHSAMYRPKMSSPDSSALPSSQASAPPAGPSGAPSAGGVGTDGLSSMEADIFHNPLDRICFERLDAVFGAAGQQELARIAARRARQLRQIEWNTKAAPSVLQVEGSWRLEENSADQLELAGYYFAGLDFLASAGGDPLLAGISQDGTAFLKIYLGEGPRVAEEVRRRLAGRGAVSTPVWLARGEIDAEHLGALPAVAAGGRFPGREALPYELVRFQRADRGGFGVADVALSLFEHQAAGVYPGCLSLSRIRFDSLAGVCRFTGYDQALALSGAERELSPRAYLDFCLEREGGRTNLEVEPSFLVEHAAALDRCFEGDRFCLGATQLFGRQRIGDVPVTSVQGVATERFRLDGSLLMAERETLLERLPVAAGERVLDLGCGAGALARFFAARGASVVAVDVEPQLVLQCRLLAVAHGAEMAASVCDLEFAFPEGGFDTVALLALLPHLERREKVCREVAATGCRRVLIEVAPRESGFRWQGAHYLPTVPAWDNGDEASLRGELRRLFPEFAPPEELGPTLGGRHLFLLEREARERGGSQ